MDDNETKTDNGEENQLEPRQAVTLLEQTTRRAERQFNLNPPLLTLLRAAVVLVGYGAIWWSVRGQHPYQGPNGAALAMIYGAVIIVLVATTAIVQRATSGVSGQSRRQRGAYGAAIATAWIAVSVFQGALYHDGASHAVVYGVFPAAAPLLVVGAVLAGMAAAREDWRQLAVAITVIALGTGSAFAGPAGVWAVIAVGGCVMCIGYAIAQDRQRRRSAIVRA